LREWIVANMSGRRKTKRLGRVQCGESAPLTEPLKVAADLRHARWTFAQQWRAVITPQARALALMNGMDFRTGDFDPPTPAAARKAA
jgi:hypothetical protein